MANAPRDGNFVPSKLAVLNTDTRQGKNLVRLAIDATTGGIKTNSTGTISFTMQPIDPRDENYVDCWLFEGTDGKTYPAVADATGALLVSV